MVALCNTTGKNKHSSTYLSLPDGQAITSTKWYGDFPLLSFCTRFWIFRNPYVDAKHNTTTPSFSRVTSWKSLFLWPKRIILLKGSCSSGGLMTQKHRWTQSAHSLEGLVSKLLHFFSKQMLGSVGKDMMEVTPWSTPWMAQELFSIHTAEPAPKIT